MFLLNRLNYVLKIVIFEKLELEFRKQVLFILKTN